ncbi:DUF4336 domain-containing protein [Methylobacterium gnaphalii]|uniref:DUF4336 domain-containing protein n=1 Tax=Methylobacterium gnaphalii TaxID=1010610 RepID=A0A512JQK4_9HYPH|nr:DUF4336 domain-containing protein [Methylobacterium gnaphalii]GEP12240.1 hypothetical protein MGN01_40850 [Methylobacterium gnaphalii]GJD70559.1 hypothetical protein MMMDOFMJ_3508 [Methylobacterium gnaphalii]GLS48521.1 hypothetical protein GCM10007885_13650 [Methylobacterium gnaphalii]
MSNPTYPPLDTLKPVAPNLWIVDSGPLHAFGMPLPVRMTVVRLASGEIWLHSPTWFDEHLRGEIEALGPIRHLVAPNTAHWTYLKDWQCRCPGALTWAAPNLRRRRPVRRSGPRLDRDLSDTPPADWAGDIDQIVVPGGFGFRETAFYHTASRTLILTDLVINLEPSKVTAVTRAFQRIAGTLAPDGRAPVYLRFVVRLGGSAAKNAARRLVALEPSRLVFSHGALIEHDATRALQRSLRWLLH